MRRRYFASAAGSVCETAAAVDLAAALGLIDENLAEDILILCTPSGITKRVVRMKQRLRALA